MGCAHVVLLHTLLHHKKVCKFYFIGMAWCLKTMGPTLLPFVHIQMEGIKGLFGDACC